MQNILAQNNIFALNEFDLSKSIVHYAPVYYSELQKRFFLRRFDQLKYIAPNLKWCEFIEEHEYDIALSWDAHFEKRAFGRKIYPRQNRLFDQIPFEITETFTSFRQLAEKILPSVFDNAVTPWDRDVKHELDYYFNQKKLPLTYLETRNELTGRDGSTKFSSFLSSGVLDVRFLYNEVRRFEAHHGATKSTGWIIFELLWREYFYWHYQKHSKKYFSKSGLKGESDFSPIQHYEPNDIAKLSDEPFYSRAIEELTTTGFLSNRARQIFASIWINDLKLDWRAGARFFEENLIDYDVYSNYGNWMYLAGVGVDPRGQRYFNVDKQLATYDPEGKYLSKKSKSIK